MSLPTQLLLSLPLLYLLNKQRFLGPSAHSWLAWQQHLTFWGLPRGVGALLRKQNLVPPHQPQHPSALQISPCKPPPSRLPAAVGHCPGCIEGLRFRGPPDWAPSLPSPATPAAIALGVGVGQPDPRSGLPGELPEVERHPGVGQSVQRSPFPAQSEGTPALVGGAGPARAGRWSCSHPALSLLTRGPSAASRCQPKGQQGHPRRVPFRTRWV